MLQSFLPQRLAQRWVDLHTPTAWTNVALNETEREIHQWPIVPSGTEGYAKAEVTGGGVDLAEVHPRTMESRKLPGLFICGEALDAFGPIGGYNFLWAWATGRAAGVGAAGAGPAGALAPSPPLPGTVRRWKRDTSAPVAKVGLPLDGWVASWTIIARSARGSVPSGT